MKNYYVRRRKRGVVVVVVVVVGANVLLQFLRYTIYYRILSYLLWQKA